MSKRTLRNLLAAAVIVVAPAAFAQMMMGPAMTADTTLGTVLVGPEGMTLYTWDNDEPGVSNCYGGCADNWPPFYVEDPAMADEDWTIVERTDGTQIWAYHGLPLYYWVNDAAPGDTTGDGVGGTWHVVDVGAMDGGGM